MPIKFDKVFFTYYPNTGFEHKALQDISFNIKDNSFTALIGHTGSGKSTLVQQINALLLPNEGDIFVNEYHIDNKSKIVGIKNLRKTAGMVFQFPEYQLFEETCFKDIIFGPLNFGEKEEELKDKAINLLKLVGLDESYLERSPFELSGGQKRRVAIAGILALEPSILILDEPTAGLDPKGAKEVMNLFENLHKLGKTIVLVTHEMSYVLKYANQAIVLNEGKIVFDSSPIKLFNNEEKCKEFNIDIPQVIKLSNDLIKAGMNIDLNKIKDEQSLINQIVSIKEGK